MASKVVWILGAGFSKPLGAPLMAELFSLAAMDDIAAAYQAFRQEPPLFKAVYRIYFWGRGIDYMRINLTQEQLRDWEDNRPKYQPRRLWDDAEAYLDVLDTEANRPSSRLADLLKPFLDGRTLNELRTMARRSLAAEVSMFCWPGAENTERWSAHQRWARDLVKPGDAIINFNYDRAVELLRPDCLVVTDPNAEMPTAASAPTLLKLHGSVDWKLGSDKRCQKTEDPVYAVTAPEKELAIATPGPSKAHMTTAFDSLWQAAEKELKCCDTVVFVGYRFPPTDNIAKRRLAAALRANNTHWLTIHVALGPNSPDADRVSTILSYALGGRSRHKTLPLFCEDLFSVAERAAITTPLDPPAGKE